MRLYLILVLSALTVYGKNGFGSTEQSWGFVKINEKARMFWWLYYTSVSNSYIERPLVIWLQGGPGGSSTGIGNFMEIGPLNVNQEQRDIHWTNHVNVLFVDNPVGTGFSYVEDEDLSYFASNNLAIAQDFLVFLQGFMEENPEFQDVPIYIFGQSYGGKMAADIAWLIAQETKQGNVSFNLKGIALGDAWISPIDSLTTWPQYLNNLGFLSNEDVVVLTNVTDHIKEEISANIYENATLYFHVTQVILNRLTTVDYYNVLNEKISNYNLKNSDWFEKPVDLDMFKSILPDSFLSKFITKTDRSLTDSSDDLYNLMNGPVLESLNLTEVLPIKWGDQSETVFQSVNLDFMKPVTQVIEKILNETDIEVSVYNGQLDLIVDTPGTIAWVDRLAWSGSEQWKAASKNPILVNNVHEGYRRSYGNFNFYWVHRAGHAVPTDNPHTMEFILKQITHL